MEKDIHALYKGMILVIRFSIKFLKVTLYKTCIFKLAVFDVMTKHYKIK